MKTNRIIQLAAGVLLLTACTSDFYEEYVNGRVPVSLGYEVLTAEESTRTAASTTLNDANIASGDAITVKIKNNGAATSAYTSYTYTAGDGGAMNPPSPKPYYPTGSTNIDILAYYPANAASNFDVAADQTTDPNYKASDLMVATVTNQARTTSTVELAFQHKMAKLVVTATAGEGVNTIQTITLKNVKRRVTFTNTSGEVGTATSISGTDVILFKSGTGTSGTGAALIPAQTITGDVLEIVTDQGTAIYNVPAGKTFNANTKYTISVTVNRTAVGATNAITWGSGENVTINPASTTQELSITIADPTYTGSALMPSFTIKDANGTTVATVPENTSGDYNDFTITWQNNTNAGTATVAAVGKTGTDYAGKACAKDFTINKADCSVTLSTTSLSPQIGSTGTFTVSRSGDGNITATSSNTSIATASVNQSNGVVTVTGVAAGTATITVTVDASDNYNAYTATDKQVTVEVPADQQVCNVSAVTSSNTDYVGYIICSNGHVHTTANPNCGGTPQAMIAYVGTASSCSHGLAIALADASTSCTWDSAASTVSSWAGSHSVSGGTWRLPSGNDWMYMFQACGGSTRTINWTDGMSYSYGNFRTKLKALNSSYDVQSDVYWSSKEYDSDNAWRYGFASSLFSWYPKSLNFYVRAVLAF